MFFFVIGCWVLFIVCISIVLDSMSFIKKKINYYYFIIYLFILDRIVFNGMCTQLLLHAFLHEACYICNGFFKNKYSI